MQLPYLYANVLRVYLKPHAYVIKSSSLAKFPFTNGQKISRKNWQVKYYALVAKLVYIVMSSARRFRCPSPILMVRSTIVRGEFFRQPILTNHVAGFLFSLRVARKNSPSGKRALPKFMHFMHASRHFMRTAFENWINTKIWITSLLIRLKLLIEVILLKLMMGLLDLRFILSVCSEQCP